MNPRATVTTLPDQPPRKLPAPQAAFWPQGPSVPAVHGHTVLCPALAEPRRHSEDCSCTLRTGLVFLQDLRGLKPQPAVLPLPFPGPHLHPFKFWPVVIITSQQFLADLLVYFLYLLTRPPIPGEQVLVVSLKSTLLHRIEAAAQ